MAGEPKTSTWWRRLADVGVSPQVGPRSAALCAFASAAFVAILCLAFSPRWETNDDIAMSMVAHGYGLAATAMPNLIFSNVLWGHLARLVPEVGGTLGYSLATLLILAAVGAVIAWGIARSGYGLVAAFAALVLILARPVLFPQFTLNAGLLMVAAIICWHLYARQNSRRLLAAGCLLALGSFLVRMPEFVLVLVGGMPLLPLRTFWSRTAARYALAGLVAAMALATLIDRAAYRDVAWQDFTELNPVRARFTDFGMAAHLKQRPEVLTQHGYSVNDIDLVQNWFFVDPKLADPKALQDMAEEVGFIPARASALNQAWYALQTWWHPSLIILVLAALALAALRPGWKVAACWALCIGAVVVLGLIGRPAIVRVYVPLASLLLIAPLLGGTPPIWRGRLATAILLVAAVLNAAAVISESRRVESSDRSLREALARFPGETIVVWGSDFPFEAAYPVLGTSSPAMSFRLYAFGVFALAPFSVALAEESAGTGFIARLTSEAGLPLVADDQRLAYLDLYCSERLRGKPVDLGSEYYGQVRVNRRRCAVVP